MTAVTHAPNDDALEQRLCFALYVASRAMTARYRSILAPLGLTYPQYVVMVALWQDGPGSVGDLGSRLKLDYNTLSPLVKRLELLGLLERARDTADQRSVRLALTRKGRALQAKAAGVHAEICAASGLTDTRRAAMVSQLRRLADELESAAG